MIRLAFAGADRMRLDDTGSLVLTLGEQQVIQHSPRVYQETNGERTLVPTHYVLADNREVSLAIGDYDAKRALVIDPVLVYSTYLGGSSHDTGYDIAVDGAGNAYLTGLTYSTDFPTRQALQPDGEGSDDVFVAKLSADGAALVYSTYLGGGAGYGIAVDGAGNAYVTGAVGWYDDFPTRNALQPASGGESDAFVAKLSADGATLVYSTYLGGLRYDWGKDIAVDSAGNAWVTGRTASGNFPTRNALQPVFGSSKGGPDAFVAKISADGATLIYSTYLGGLDDDYGNGIAVDDRDDVYVTGITQVYRNDASTFPIRNALQPTFGGYQDAFVTKLSADGSTLIYSTYLGGNGGDEGLSIAVDGAGNAYVTGSTWARDFPTRQALQTAYGGETDAFIAKLSAAGATLVYATYLGGSGSDTGTGIAVDSAGHAYVTGWTYSIDFPTRDVLQPGSGGNGDAFVAKFSADGAALLYSTYLGGSNGEGAGGIAVNGLGNAYVTGSTGSTDFPTRKPLRPTYRGEGDVYIAKISEGKSAPVMAPLRVLSLGDVSGDGIPDIAVVLKEGPAGDLSVRIMDAVGGASIRTFRCDPGYVLIDLAVVPDQNGNGAPELALLGRKAATSDMQVEVHDTLSGDRLHAIVFDLGDRTPKRLAVLADPDGGTAQLAVLAATSNPGYAAVQIRDARTGAWVGDVQFDPDYDYRGFAVVADVNGNGAPELAMLGIKKTFFETGKNKVELRDSRSGLLVRDLWSQTGANPLDLVEVPDAAGVGPSDVAVLEQRGTNVVVKTTDTGTAAEVGFVYYNPNFMHHQLTALPDLDGNGVAEVALLGRNAEGQTKTELRDVVTGTLVRNLWFEGLAPADLAVLPDLNGNGSPEVAVLGTTPTGRVRVLIQDVGTKALVSRLTF
ncbi:SBBP repeat-containing protein [uncultured Lamprocystis sp.]|uniref:SBBP repeat-containing protein n=1 Tax=uncultured Lamprocystis sp. TaxID=543132 RepID=UPI0025E49BEF|nr:SBBP repeat-containing protein [uncultured Lamprocystis sp.]